MFARVRTTARSSGFDGGGRSEGAVEGVISSRYSRAGRDWVMVTVLGAGVVLYSAMRVGTVAEGLREVFAAVRCSPLRRLMAMGV